MTQPGWYDSPNEPGLLRWWDGNQWTANTSPRPSVQPVEPAGPSDAYLAQQAVQPVQSAQIQPQAAYSPYPAAQALSAPNIWHQDWNSGIEFQVGTSEVHRVAFTYDKFWGSIKIYVDGQPVIQKTEVFSLSLTKTWDFQVGVMERHDVRIMKTRKLMFAGFRGQLVQAFVDGQLVGKYEA